MLMLKLSNPRTNSLKNNNSGKYHCQQFQVDQGPAQHAIINTDACKS